MPRTLILTHRTGGARREGANAGKKRAIKTIRSWLGSQIFYRGAVSNQAANGLQARLQLRGSELLVK